MFKLYSITISQPDECQEICWVAYVKGYTQCLEEFLTTNSGKIDNTLTTFFFPLPTNL